MLVSHCSAAIIAQLTSIVVWFVMFLWPALAFSPEVINYSVPSSVHLWAVSTVFVTQATAAESSTPTLQLVLAEGFVIALVLVGFDYVWA